VRFKRVWARLLGVEHTVIEQVGLDEDPAAIVAWCGRSAVSAAAAAAAVDPALATTTARGADAGARWTSGSCGCSWRPRRRG
jgi:hypothetical protein